MKKLEQLLSELESLIPKQEFTCQKISASPVGWHIEHSLLAINLIIDQLKKSNPEDYRWSFNVKRMLVFTFNKIPRGKAKAPKVVQPIAGYNSGTLKKHLDIAKVKVKELNTINPDACFDHPFFGKLKLKPTVKFLVIHTKHHISIMKDIVGSGCKQ